MRSRAERLQVLVRLAALAEERARRRLGRTNAELQQREAQQTELDAYAAEYANHWIELGRRGVDGRTLGRLGAFRASLDAVREVQSQAVDLARNSAIEAIGAWHGTRNRLRTLDELASRLRDAEARQAEREEQHQLDDLQQRGSGRTWLA